MAPPPPMTSVTAVALGLAIVTPTQQVLKRVSSTQDQRPAVVAGKDTASAKGGKEEGNGKFHDGYLILGKVFLGRYSRLCEKEFMEASVFDSFWNQSQATCNIMYNLSLVAGDIAYAWYNTSSCYYIKPQAAGFENQQLSQFVGNMTCTYKKL